jgi:hypothetical protein
VLLNHLCTTKRTKLRQNPLRVWRTLGHPRNKLNRRNVVQSVPILSLGLIFQNKLAKMWLIRSLMKRLKLFSSSLVLCTVSFFRIRCLAFSSLVSSFLSLFILHYDDLLFQQIFSRLFSVRIADSSLLHPLWDDIFLGEGLETVRPPGWANSLSDL